MSGLTDKDWAVLRKIWARTGGNAWEPPDPSYPWLARMIEAGFFRRVNGRFGVEIIPDAMIAWTEAGRTALSDGGGSNG